MEIKDVDPKEYGIRVYDAPQVTDADIADLYRGARSRTGIVIRNLERFLDVDERVQIVGRIEQLKTTIGKLVGKSFN